MMTCVRTHYFIDMITSVIVAHYMFMFAEKITYVLDVSLLKIGGSRGQLARPGAGEIRRRKWFKPCHKCGWSNIYAGDCMSENEKRWLKHVYGQCQAMNGATESKVGEDLMP